MLKVADASNSNNQIDIESAKYNHDFLPPNLWF